MSNTFAMLPRDDEQDQPLTQALYRSIRVRVIKGDLLPGTRLSEVEVASAYSVSRQPVREAFIKLADEALVEIRPQRGTFVSRIHVPSVMSARFVREAVEADIVRLLAERSSAALVSRLRAVVVAQADAVENADPERFLELDEAFHRLLAAESGNAASWDVLQPLKTQMDRFRHLSAREFPLRELLAQHEAVVGAIEAGNAPAADRAMRAHLRKILDDLSQIVAALPAHFDGAEQLA